MSTWANFWLKSVFAPSDMVKPEERSSDVDNCQAIIPRRDLAEFLLAVYETFLKIMHETFAFLIYYHYLCHRVKDKTFIIMKNTTTVIIYAPYTGSNVPAVACVKNNKDHNEMHTIVLRTPLDTIAFASFMEFKSETLSAEQNEKLSEMIADNPPKDYEIKTIAKLAAMQFSVDTDF